VADKVSSHWPITSTNGAAALFNLFLPLVLVRILSPDQVGQYKIFFLYVMLSPGLFLVTGLNNGLYHWTGKYPETKPEVRQSWSLLVGITLVLCAIGMVLSARLAPFIKISVLDLRLLLLCMPFFIGSAFIEDLLIARGDIWAGSLYASGFNVLRAVSIVAAAWWTRSVEWVIYVFAAGTVIRALVGWLWFVKWGEIQFSFSWEKSRVVLRYALPVSIAAMAALALQNVDQMILSFRLNPAQFAFYSIGCLSIPPLDIFEISVNRVLIPGLSRAFSAKDYARAAALFAEGVSELCRFLLPATLGLMIYATPIIHILFTDRYAGAAVYLRYYALTYLLFALPFDAIARSRADGGWILRTYLIFSTLCVAATWFAAGRWGAMGALIAVLSSQFLMRVYTLAYARRCFGASLSHFLPLPDLGIQVGLVVAATASSFILRPLFSDVRTWFWVTGPLFTLIYFVGMYAIYLRRHITSSEPIHVLELAQTVCLGGLERMIYCLSRELHHYPRFKVLVATYDHGDDQPSLVSQFNRAGIPIIQWQKGKGFSVQSVFRLVRLIFSEKTRILHAHNLGPLIYGSLAKCVSLGRVRLVLTLHSVTDLDKSRRYQLYFKFFLRFADRIIAVSPSIQASLIALGVSPQRIEVIPNGVLFPDTPSFNDQALDKVVLRRRLIPNLTPEIYQSRWILCLARLHPGKGQDLVLDVWSALPKEARGGLALFFVGQETHAGYWKWLDQKIRAVPDSGRVLIAGPSEQPQEWIQSADLFISGSLQEGMPLAPIEAAGSGLPTVLSDIEGHRFLKPWAYYFDPIKPEEGAGRILDILKGLDNEEAIHSLESRWTAAAPLRQQWSAPAMTASYAETFESA